MTQSSQSENRIVLLIECHEYDAADRYSQMAHLVHCHDIDEQTLIQESLDEEALLEVHQTVIALKAMGPAVKRLSAWLHRIAMGFRFANLPLKDCGTPIYDQLVLENAERQLAELKAITDAEVAEAAEHEAALDAAWVAEHKLLNKKNRYGLLTWLSANAPHDISIAGLTASSSRAELMSACEEVLNIKYARSAQ